LPEIPPLGLYSGIPSRIRPFISAHADELNRATRKVVAGHQGARTVVFDQEHIIDLNQPGKTGFSSLYLAWAQSLLAADPGCESARPEAATDGHVTA
jgi:hypothetical protein